MSDIEKPRDREGDGTVTVTLPALEPAIEKPAADEPIPIRVEVIGGPMDGLSQGSDGKTFHIGRGRESDLRLSMDRMVSGRHARIVREGRLFWLEDNGSRNGTFVGDEKITSRILIGPGAKFRVGKTILEFLLA